MTGRNEVYIENPTANREFQEKMHTYFEKNASDSMILNVSGGAGIGKSKFLRNRYENFIETHDTIPAAFIEVSACNHEIDVLNLLAANLQKNIEDINFYRFHYLYKWFYGEYAKKKYDVTQTVEEAANQLYDQEFEPWKEEGIRGLIKIAEKLLEKSNYRYPFYTMIQIIRFFYERDKENKEVERDIKILEELSGDIGNERGRRKELCKAFCKDFSDWQDKKENRKILIFMDNFCIDSSTGLHQNVEWLSGEEGIPKQIHSAWIIGSRKQYESIADVFMELHGFSPQDAEEYIKLKCNMKALGIGEEKENVLTGAMLEASQENQVYLPYKLNIVTNHFNVLVQDRYKNHIEEIDEKEFVTLAESDEFVGRYYYMDLPEYLVNAAQILSCLNTWDNERVDTICKRFYHYLFHTKYFLENNLPIEFIDDNHYKLHEAIREALYKNRENMIKHDVQEYIFQEYSKACALKTEEMLELADMKFFQNYGMLLVDYLEFQKVRKSKEAEKFIKNLYQFEKSHAAQQTFGEYYETFFKGFDRVHNANCGTSNVTPDFILLYETLLERFKKIFSEQDKEVVVPDYIYRKLDLANLYSDIGEPASAEAKEQESLEATETLRVYVKENYPDNIVAEFELLRLELKCKNALAFEKSFQWNSDAYKVGKAALERAEQIIAEIVDQIDGQLLQPLKVSMSGKNTAITTDYYGKYVQAFEALIKMSVGEGEQQKKAKVLLNLLREEVNHLRGNFPWYCIKFNHMDEIDILDFAKNTYMLRKAQNEACKKEKIYQPNWSKELTAYHNIGVYALKLKKEKIAVTVLGEAIEKRKKELKSFELKHFEQQIRKKEVEELRGVPDKTEGMKEVLREILIHLNPKELDSKDYYTEHDETLESMMYYGNCFLEFGTEYKKAEKYLAQVFLNRYVRRGMDNQKTLDCGVRLAVVEYLLGNQETAQRLAEQITVFSNAVSAPKISSTILAEINQKKKDGYRKLEAAVRVDKNEKNILKILEEDL